MLYGLNYVIAYLTSVFVIFLTYDGFPHLISLLLHVLSYRLFLLLDLKVRDHLDVSDLYFLTTNWHAIHVLDEV